MMPKSIYVLVIGMLMLASCTTEPESLPTLASDATSGQTATEQAPPQTSQTTSTDDRPDLTLTQTIESETGITYQLPAGWVVDDNASVSNFASDADAQLDALNLGSPESRRWMVLGSISIASPDQIMGLSEATSFEEAAARLHEYYNTADFSLNAPGLYLPGNDKSASVAVGLNPDMPGWATAVYYMETDTDDYIVLFFESPANIMMQITSMRDAIIAGAYQR